MGDKLEHYTTEKLVHCKGLKGLGTANVLSCEAMLTTAYCMLLC